MPRIEDRLLKSVIYLYKSKEDAESGAPGGSGFLVGEPCAIPEAVFLFAVTNAHVARSCPVIRTAGPVNKRVVVRKESDWYRHPDQDDVVVTPIGFAQKDARDFYLDYVPRDWFVTTENFSHATHDVNDLQPDIEALPPLNYKWEHQPLGWPFGPGEEVVMLGRFLGYDGTDENEPAARFGHLAMASPVPIKHPWGFTQPSFLIECRSVSGFSGSAIFIYRVQTTVAAGLVAIGSDHGGKAALPRLLGIDWANLDRVGHNDYAIDWAESEADASFPRRSGMMVAVPAWRLAELLDSEVVQTVKRKKEAEAKKASEEVNLDFRAIGVRSVRGTRPQDRRSREAAPERGPCLGQYSLASMMAKTLATSAHAANAAGTTSNRARARFPLITGGLNIVALRRWIKLKARRRFRKALGAPQSAKIHRPKIKNSHSGNRENPAERRLHVTHQVPSLLCLFTSRRD